VIRYTVTSSNKEIIAYVAPHLDTSSC